MNTVSHNVELEKLLDGSDSMQREFERIIRIFSVPTELRSQIPIALASLSMEHASAMRTLVRQQHYASASALFRPQFDAVVRAIWFSELANDSQLAEFKLDSEKDGVFPKTFEMFDQCEALDTPIVPILKSYHSTYKNRMHSFTHGGFLAVKLHATPYEKLSTSVYGMIKSSNGLLVLAAMASAYFLDAPGALDLVSNAVNSAREAWAN
ncbi:DUF6988 family protein [Arenimonas oryziterrae]|uniref:DUF6988 family protein n=1 Tax=Arenimonas oryziterrae TaxID=498055 RepID=UPI0012E06E9B|nr:hypothetical protein [Arenimonas oryziterrae]